MNQPRKHRAYRTVLAASPLVLAIALVLATWMKSQAASTQPASPQNLAVLWTSGDPEVAHRVAFMYTKGAAKQDWFGHPSLRRLVSEGYQIITF